MLSFLTGEQDEPSHATESPLLADMRQTQHSHPLKLEQNQNQSKSPKNPVSCSPCLEKSSSRYAPGARAQSCPLFKGKL